MNIIEKTSYFNKIIAENDKTIRRIAFFYCPDKDLLDDLYQEIAINIWESLDSFEGKSQISTWIYRIAINVSILFSKKNSYKKKLIYFSALPEFESNYFVNESIENDKMLKQLYFLVGQLNTIDKAIMFLYLDKRSHKEIADIMGFSVTNIGTKINRIVKKLKEINTKIEFE